VSEAVYEVHILTLNLQFHGLGLMACSELHFSEPSDSVTFGKISLTSGQ
jgi:hypothetical protein